MQPSLNFFNPFMRKDRQRTLQYFQVAHGSRIARLGLPRGRQSYVIAALTAGEDLDLCKAGERVDGSALWTHGTRKGNLIARRNREHLREIIDLYGLA
jgi:hypothetical protein